MSLQILPFIAVIIFLIYVAFNSRFAFNKTLTKWYWVWIIVGAYAIAISLTGFFTSFGFWQYIVLGQIVASFLRPFFIKKDLAFDDSEVQGVVNFFKNAKFLSPLISLAGNFAILYFGGFFDLLMSVVSK